MSPLSSIVVTVTALTLSGSALATSFSLGAAAGRSSSIYKGVSAKNKGLPFISIVGEHAYLKGNQLGYALLPNKSPQNIMFGLEYNGEILDPSDSDDPAMQKLDTRKSTTMVNAKVKYGVFFGKIAYDISDRHSGYYALAGAAYPIETQSWTITPSLAMEYNDKKMSDYRYGVSRSESLRSGFREYQSDSTNKISLAVNSRYKLTSSFSILLGASYDHYNDISDSPIVDKNYKVRASAGFILSF